MRKIFFIRHAKSSWKDPSLSDVERPLNSRGRRDAPKMAEKLSFLQPKVDLILCSPAIRAQLTCDAFEQVIKSKDKLTLDKIYHASRDELIQVIRQIDNGIHTALIFGHNPGFTYVYNYFSDNYLDNLPTCGVFELSSEADWQSMEPSNTIAGHLIYPKMFSDDSIT